MFRIALLLAFVLISRIHADEKPPVPKQPVVSKGYAEVEGMDVKCAVLTTEFIHKDMARKVIKDGKEIVEVKTIRLTVSRYVQEYYKLVDVRGFRLRPDRQDPTKLFEPLDSKTLTQLLDKEGIEVLISRTEQVPPKHLKRAKTGTIVLILPRSRDLPNIAGNKE